MDRQSLSEAEVNAQSDGHHVCIVCFSDLAKNTRAKLPCGHDDMCGVCHLRLRFLHDDTKCPICKQSNDTIIVDKDEMKTFDDYPRWGDEIGTGFVYKKDVGMFFEESYYNESIVPLYELSCHKCKFSVDESVFVNQHLNNEGNKDEKGGGGKKKKKKPRRLLEDHLRAKHRLSMCHLCIDNKRDFISQLPRFTPSQLQNHMKKGDGPGSGFNGHPVCEFCHPKRFYDVNQLHKHLHKEHYKCHICEKQGNDNQWFKHYRSLARHFDKQHFMCHHVQCQQARFVVFENELDLRAHEISVHGGTSTGSTKINLEFNIRRANGGGGGGDRQNTPSQSDFNYGLDGQAFVPPALADDNNNNGNSTSGNSNVPNNESLLHPQHIQRTEELRAQAAAVRQQQSLNSEGESFPTLQSVAAPAPSSAPLVSWTSGTGLRTATRSNRNVGQVTTESFPSLQSDSANTNNKKKAMKGSIGATRRQFAAMTTSANQQQPPSASWGGSNATVSSPPLSAMAAGQNNFFASATPVRQANRQADLAPDNFPSLGGGSSTSANRLANQNFQRKAARPPSMNSASDFPSMQSSGQSTPSNNSFSIAKAAKTTLKPPPSMNSASDFPSMQSNGRSTPRNNSFSVARAAKIGPKPPPFMSSVSDFPAPPMSKKSAKAAMRDKVLGDYDKKMPAENNFLQVDMSAATSKNAQATIEEMKASMGKNFKQLKKLTKTFAQEQLSPEGYIDQAAALFDREYEDPDFWSYLPSLLQSCPNQGSSKHALKYMNSLKRQREQASKPRFAAKAQASAQPSSQWGGASSNKSNVMRQVAPPPLPAAYSAPMSLTQPAAAGMCPQVMASKKKSAWAAGGKSTVVRTKAPPGSVGAAVQDPRGGTSTKYMAKQQKKQQAAKNNNNQQQNKAKKKKQKNELRDLAFGK